MADTKNMTTITRLDHPINIYFIEKFLRRAMPRMPHQQFALKTPMPAHAGDTVKWRRMSNPTAQTTPLIEGEDPTPIMPEKTDLSASLKEYGAVVKTSSWLDLVGLSQEGARLTEWLADQFKLTMDTLNRDTLAGSGSSTTCSNGADMGGAATMLNLTDIKTVVRNLLGELAEFIEGPIKAGTGQGTSPIRDSFVCIIHTDLIHVVEALPGFKHFVNYSSYTGIYDGEWGAVNNVRFIQSTNAYKSGSNYYLPIIAREAYGNVEIPEGRKLLIKHSPQQTGSPLERFGTYGWLTNNACRILNDNWVHILICTAS